MYIYNYYIQALLLVYTVLFLLSFFFWGVCGVYVMSAMWGRINETFLDAPLRVK